MPCAVLLEEFAVDAGLVVVALEVGLGDERDEVLVARHVAREHDQVVGRLSPRSRLWRLPGAT